MECDGAVAVLSYYLISGLSLILMLTVISGYYEISETRKQTYMDFVGYVNLMRGEGVPISATN